MKSSPIKASFPKESDLCAAFIAALPAEWTAYAETAGYDILLVHADGTQVGIEAKLVLNTKVIIQIVASLQDRYCGLICPDYLAVLIPWGCKSPELVTLTRYMGVAVIEQHDAASSEEHRKANWARKAIKFKPDLPNIGARYEDYYSGWRDQMPAERCKLPDYVPDVVAGAPAPSTLSEWKIGAIKLSILLEKRGEITSMDFKTLRIHRQRWLECKWVTQGDQRGHYVIGPRPLNLRAQHPINYAQIEADFEKWAPAEVKHG